MASAHEIASIISSRWDELNRDGKVNRDLTLESIIAQMMQPDMDELAIWRRMKTESIVTHCNILRGDIALSRAQALHIAGATDYDTFRDRLAKLRAAVQRAANTFGTTEVEYEKPDYYQRVFNETNPA